MQGNLGAPLPQADESMWLYFMCDCASERSDSAAAPVADLVRELGWHVLLRSVVARRPDALTDADACIADLGCCEDVAADLAEAQRADRPILALRPEGAEPGPRAERLLSRYSRARVVAFSDSDECMVRVREALTDREWLATHAHQGDV